MQRELERQGLATVGISLLRRVTEKLRPPRTYFVRYPFGHALGEPFRSAQQQRIFREALAVLETATQPGTIVDSPYRWRRARFE